MQPTKEPVVSEKYDEVVFTDPKESFYQQLLSLAEIPKVVFGDPTVQECFGTFNDEETFLKLLEAQSFLQKDLQSVKDRMKVATEEMEQIDGALREIAETKKAAVASSRAAVAKSKATMAAGGGPASKKSKAG